MAKAKLNEKDRIEQLKDILIMEARKQSMSNPLRGLPFNHYDEVFENCYLGDA